MSELLGLLFTFAPLFLLMFIANVAERRREAGLPYQSTALIAYLGAGAIFLLTLMAGLTFQALGTMLQRDPALMDELFQVAGGDLNPLAQFESPGLMGLWLWSSSLAGLLLLLPPVRRLAARFMPLDPESPVHGVALSWSMFVLINLAFTLGVGLGNLTELMQAAEDMTSAATMVLLWGQQILTAALALVGVGWLTRRNLAASLARAGIVRPTGQQLLIGLGFGLAMAPVVLVVAAIATHFNIGIDPDADALTEELLGPLFGSAWGILTLGLAAALGEETLFRGAVQPRFGILVTALLFALLHSNYGFTISTLVVFLLGLILGYLRNRHNTSTAMVMHAVYNMTLGLLAILGASFLDS